MKIAISIVSYNTDDAVFKATLSGVFDAVRFSLNRLSSIEFCLCLFDNHDLGRNIKIFDEFINRNNSGDLFTESIAVNLSRNIGYGAAHNMILDRIDGVDFYLLLNPDVILSKDSIYQGLNYMSANSGVVLLAPKAVNSEGDYLYLCKRFPTIMNLAMRGIFPEFVKNRLKSLQRHYEMHDMALKDCAQHDVPIVSGCCMLIRGDILLQSGGFDSNYFLYFEDFDLSLRLGRLGDIVYLPSMKIIHFGGNASRKGLKHIIYFVRSAIRFYQTYGWRWF